MLDIEAQLRLSGLLIITIILSGLIGAERERRDKSAGLRTHILVGVAACLLTIISKEAFIGGDPSRIASNIITGVGFLGSRRHHRASKSRSRPNHRRLHLDHVCYRYDGRRGRLASSHHHHFDDVVHTVHLAQLEAANLGVRPHPFRNQEVML